MLILVVVLIGFFALSSSLLAVGGVLAWRRRASKDATAKAKVFEPVLSWADPTQWRLTTPAPEFVARGLQHNKQAVQAANDAGSRFDFLLYGDSITQFHTEHPEVFAKYYGGLKAKALGVWGNTIEQLAYRITGGAERPNQDPKCIALMIGINNLLTNKSIPYNRLEELLRWLQRAYPTSKLVLMSLLPNDRQNSAGRLPAANAKYRDLAAKLGITFADCGQSLVPATHTSDGLHPNAPGHDIVQACLWRIVAPLVKT